MYIQVITKQYEDTNFILGGKIFFSTLHTAPAPHPPHSPVLAPISPPPPLKVIP